jgi:phosphoribosylaminoimidazole-succinocarboxamide synthase
MPRRRTLGGAVGAVAAASGGTVNRTMTPLADLPLIASGKVREMYDLGPSEDADGHLREQLLMVASDRISTYDAVHPTPIPDKGKVLTGLSAFWFEGTRHIVDNHMISATEGVPEEAHGRALVVRKLRMLPVECVVRGYITGSGWKDYQRTGSVSGIELPAGLRESERLPEPIFTPSTKALAGHDEAIDFERAAELVGDSGLMQRVRDVSIELYSFASEHARENGVILADTKFEFGLEENDPAHPLILGDEALTPDSSRYWPASDYTVGEPQPSFDKQYVRDWATRSGWDKRPPAPPIPHDVVVGTRARYVEAYALITGEPYQAWVTRTDAVADHDLWETGGGAE